MNPLSRATDWLFVRHWRAIDADRHEATESAAGVMLVRYDWRPLVVLATVAISLTLQEYWGDRGDLGRLFPEVRAGYSAPDYQLLEFVWWTGWRVFGYVIIPAIVILLLPGERLRDYGLRFKGFFRHFWIYALLFALILPVVILASRTASFQATYPFYDWAHLAAWRFWSWEGLYAIQFLSLEFFFRGFILQGLRERLGSAAIFVMIVPYCMIHYGKPWPETMGAIGAGVILGTLAMRTRSIWPGVLIHVAVALTMDLLAVRHCPDPATLRRC